MDRRSNFVELGNLSAMSRRAQRNGHPQLAWMILVWQPFLAAWSQVDAELEQLDRAEGHLTAATQFENSDLGRDPKSEG